MKAVYETSNKGAFQISCIKYRNLNNISHYHSDFELIYVNEGSAEVVVNDRSFHLCANESVFVHSNSIHNIQADKNAVVSVLKADKNLLDKIFSGKTVISPLIGKEKNAGEFIESIFFEIKKNDGYSATMIENSTVCFFIELLRDAELGENKKDLFVKRSMQELFRELCGRIALEYDTITFEEAAKYMNFSEPHFSKVFHSIFGMTFTQYLNTVRIAAALEKIRQGNMSITEISGSCGFNTIRNFNRVFKRLTGYSPKNIPRDYVFLYSLQDGQGLNPTLNCTEIIE